ncbi:MAG: pyridoxamine 5'-phosphate oxidase family protein [Pseudomonadales bacterium]|nr:pyridoxamine 5'-phosphate oxidase family protein [Pseudomonadales bacterium]
MAEQFEQLAPDHITFIGKQHLYFVATAAAEGYVNLSPKGMDSFRIVNQNTVRWLNLTGSGNETAAHLLENPRMTIMFCSFDRQPLILRLYGQARTIHPRDDEWTSVSGDFPHFTGARQIYELDIEMVQTSCGYAVPFYEFRDDRQTLTKWADNRGAAGIRDYWTEENRLSLDGKPTGIDPV